MSWSAFENAKSIGQRGSENGFILRDEEHANGARITLERDGQTAPFAVTCGIYGWMVHTRFFGDQDEAQRDFESMKGELSNIVRTIPLANDSEADSRSQAVLEMLSEFVKRFP